VFKANTASYFDRFEDGAMSGWKTGQRGALGEDALGYALALFVFLAELDQRDALKHLRGNGKAAFKWACKELGKARREDLVRLRAVERKPDSGPYR
jgi:hypothetical protein